MVLAATFVGASLTQGMSAAGPVELLAVGSRVTRSHRGVRAIEYYPPAGYGK
jgi:hypothetical protein